LNLGGRRLVALLLGQLGQRHGVLDTLLQRALAVDRGGEPVALAHDRLGPGGIVPETGILREGGQLVEAQQGLVPVKDASAGAGALP
jgi:hypothetical protein